MTATLGISAYYHDAAAAVVVDGRLVAAAQEERFSRNKHDASFPAAAVRYCLGEAGLGIAEVDRIVFYERPLAKFDRLLETHLAYAPRRPASFRRSMGPWLSWKLRMAARLRRELGLRRSHPLRFCDHHRAHARSALECSPFERAAIVTIDAVGEWATTTICAGDHGAIEPRLRLDFPHSLGLLYSTFTALAGFEVNDGEYKLMGLAPLGSPRFVEPLLSRIISVREDGSFQLNQDCFDFTGSDAMFTDRLLSCLGVSPRQGGQPIRDVDRDLAASIQQVTEEIVERICKHAVNVTGCDRLCLAGGVALNCSATGRLVRSGHFRDVWVQPAAGDAGGAIGAALEVDRESSRDRSRSAVAFSNRLGPHFDDEAIRESLDALGVRYRGLDDRALLAETAELLAGGKVVGWFQGRMEFGPRALGSRSILADPRNEAMQATLNRKVKRRESFRPFAPAVLRVRAREWFDMSEDEDRPFMTFVFPLRPEKRGQLPAVTHVDGTARVQTVSDDDDPRLATLLEAFERLTGVPVLVNTSFNVAGEPIVCSPRDAVRCFLATQIDALVIGNQIALKSDQPVGATADAAPGEPRRCPKTRPLTRSLSPAIRCAAGGEGT